ncbi:DUF4175 family protein [uncultured Rubinisphaera sp.]|uniref:DUF4175 family protein n=2 Tax=Rubinisphaera TaxID=1649490 RepID=UPI0030DCF89C
MSQTYPHSATSTAGLPVELRNELAQLDRRLRWVSFSKGFGGLMFVGLVLASLFLTTDYLFPLPGSIRFGFLCLLGLTVIWLVYQWLILPLARKRRWPELAYMIDSSFPDLQERVSSTVELSMNPYHGLLESAFMRDRLRQETNSRLTKIDLWECLSLRSMAIALVGATLFTIVAAFPFLLNAQGYSLLWQRLLTPWVNLDSATNLTFIVENGDRTVPRGNDALIVAEPQWRYHEGTLPRQIRLTWTNERGESQSREMSYDVGRNAYIGKIPQLMANITYNLSSTGARSRTYAIEVADRPRIVDVRLIIDPPAYTNVPQSIVEGAIGTIRVIEGSQLTAELTFEHPVAQADWVWQTQRLTDAGPAENLIDPNESTSPTLATLREPAVLSEDGLKATIRTLATQSDQFQFAVSSSNGLTNIDEPHRLIQIVPDRAPRIDMGGTNDPVKVKTNDVIPIELQADDDFGLMDVHVLVEHLSAAKNNAVLIDWKSEQTGSEVRQLSEKYEIDLSRLELNAGDIIGYRAVARDGRPVPGPNETWTSRRVLMIDNEVKTIAGQEVEDFYANVRRHADIVKNEIAAHRKDIEKERHELDPKPRTDADKKIEEKRPEWMQTKLSLSLQLEDLARKLETRPITTALSQMQVKPAQELIEETARTLEEFAPKNENDSIELIRKHEEQVREAERSLDRLLNQLRDAERIEEELTELQQLARRAKQLAEQAGQLNETEQKDNESSSAENVEQEQTEQPESQEQQPLEKLNNEWAALTQDLEQLMNRRPELKQAAKNSLLSEIAEAAKVAEDLAKQQTALSEATQADQQVQSEFQQPLTAELKETAELAEQLASKSAEEAQKTAAPLFDPSKTKEAVREQEATNLGKASELLEKAKAALERFQEQSEQAEALPEDAQQAANEIAKRSRELAQKMYDHHEKEKGFDEQDRHLKQEQKNFDNKFKNKVLDQEAEQQQTELNERKQANDEAIEKINNEKQKLAEQLAGLMEAADAVDVPPNLHHQKRDVLLKMDESSEELLARTDRADDRLRDAASNLENLARNINEPEKRAEITDHRLKPLTDQAEQLAKEMAEKANKEGEPDPNAGPELAKRQLEQVRNALGTDTVGEEEKLAEAVKTGMQANEELKKNDLKKATETQQKFAEQLAELNQAIKDAAQKAKEQQAQDQQADATEKPVESSGNPEKSADDNQSATQENPNGENPAVQNDNATAENAASKSKPQAWNEANLPPELKELRFPKDQISPEKVKEELERLAEAQQKLNEKTNQTIAENSAPEKEKDLNNKLRNLANEQRSIADQTKRLTGSPAALPRMHAQQAQKEATEALQESKPEEATQAQQQAVENLEQAIDQIERQMAGENTPQDANPETPSADSKQLAEDLQEKLAELDRKIAQAKSATSQEMAQAPKADAQTSEENPTAAEAPPEQSPSAQELSESLQALQTTQQRIAEQAEQLAQQAEAMNPDQKSANEKLRNAANAAQKASEQLKNGQLQQGTSEASQASENLSQATDEGLESEPAQHAAEQLADQQQQVAEQLQALAQNPQATKQAREMTQAEIQAQTQALAEAFKRLAEESQAKPIDERRNSEQLANLQKDSQEATENMQQSLQESQEGNLQASGQASQKAAQQLQQLAKQSSELANTKRDTMVPENVGDEAADASRMLQQAKESLQNAMQEQAQQQQQANSEGTPNAPASEGDSSQSQANSSQTPQSGQPTPSSEQSALQQLAQQLAQAAQDLNQAHQNLQPPQQNSNNMSQQQAQAEGSPSNPSEDADSNQGNQTLMSGSEQPDGTVMRSALMRDWGKKQGELEADLTDARRRTIDQEYAPLIQSYFKSLSTPEKSEK